MFHWLRRLASERRERRKEKERSPQWSAVRDHFLHGRTCAGCGATQHLQVHHVEPFHLHPERELDPTNLIVLCMDKPECHFRLGHGGNWKYWVPSVRTLADSSLHKPQLRKGLATLAKEHRVL